MDNISKFMIVEAAILSASFVFACPALAEQPVSGNPLSNLFQSQPRAARVAPKSGFQPLPYSLRMTDTQMQLSRLGKQYATETSPTGRLGPTGFPISAIGDFPLPKLNFPREISEHN